MASGPNRAPSRPSAGLFRNPQTDDNRMASEPSAPATLEVWPRAVMATLLLLITLLTAHLVQLTWFDADVTTVSPAPDLARQP